MKYYDGPAFFRRQDLVKSRRQKKAVFDQKPNIKLSNQRRHPQAKQVAPVAGFHKADDQTPAFLKEIQNFVPKKQSAGKQHSQASKLTETRYQPKQQQRRQRYYDQLKAALTLSDDQLITMTTEVDDQPEQDTQAVSPKLANLDRNQVVKTDQVSIQASSHPRQLQEGMSPKGGAVEPHKPATFPKDDRSQTAKDETVQPEADSQGALQDRRLAADEHKRNVHHGLGQSLSTIVTNERAVQPDLSLFQDKAAASNPEVSPNNSETDQESKGQPEQVKQSLPAISQDNGASQTETGYQFPSMTLLARPEVSDDHEMDEWIERQIETLDKTFQAFKVNAQVVDWTDGPTVTQFQIKLALGVKVSRITNLTDDLKLALAAKDIRIEAPIPGKSTVGIEIPNPTPRPVVLSEIITTDKFKTNQSPLTTAVGVDLSGVPRIADIRKMPHGLIAGATGSGKSVFINSLLVSLLYKATPADLKLLLIDPKAVELAPYDGIPHLLSPVISDPQSAAAALHWVTDEMDQRYEKLSAAGVKNIEQFNQEAEKRSEFGLKIPYILVIIDELADLMMAASSEVEEDIVRITQKARAAGIHLIVATQRPSVDIVTGTIKNNIPSRIAFMVSSQVDSRTILDNAGAERLLGKGDMLYLGNGASQPIRLQGAYVTNHELENVVDFVRQQGQPHYLFTPDSLKEAANESQSEDTLMPSVMKFIAQEDTISTSKLQRVFSIGYNRAANIIDSLQDRHLISEQRGSKPRMVYYHPGEENSVDEELDSDEPKN